MPCKLHARIVLTVSFIFCAQLIWCQNTLDKAGLTGTTLSTVAYSMRLLSTTYAGNALEVRRSSDNATQNIGYTTNGDLDTAALKTFVGGSNGFVSIWYDQSGNSRNLTQAVNSNQPSLVIAGTIIRENGKPFIAFYGVGGGSFNSLDLASDITTVGHVSAVHRFAVGGDGFILGHTGSYYWHSAPGTSLFEPSLVSASILAGSFWSNGASSVITSIIWPITLTINEAAPSSPSVGTNWNNIGKDRVYHHTTGGGGYSELIVFPAILPKGSRNSLEFGQSTYFSVLVTLPITWLGFTAQIQGSNVLLKWQTGNEQNTKEFIIQYSTDGIAFQNIGITAAVGNSNRLTSYSYLHTNPMNGNNYYRLIQMDLDGRSNYSIVTKVKTINERVAFTVLGNPVTKNQLTLNVSVPILLSLYSSNGKLIWNKQLTEGIQVINVSGYTKGIYLLKNKGYSEKILIE